MTSSDMYAFPNRTYFSLLIKSIFYFRRQISQHCAQAINLWFEFVHVRPITWNDIKWSLVNYEIIYKNIHLFKNFHLLAM